MCVCVCVCVCLETSSKRQTRSDVGYYTTEKILQLLLGVLFNYKDDRVSNGVASLAAILQILTPPPL
jgi:hypothetical protein